MPKRTYVQLAVIVCLGLGTVQLSSLSTQSSAGRPAVQPGPGSRPSSAVAHSAPRALTPNARVRIDGRQNPEQIPDELAFRLYLKAITVQESPTPQQVRMQRAFVKRLELAEADEAVLFASLRRMSPELARVERERRLLTKGDPSGVSKQIALKSREERALDDARATLLGRLSSDGWQRVEAHVRDHVKGSVTVFEVTHGAH